MSFHAFSPTPLHIISNTRPGLKLPREEAHSVLKILIVVEGVIYPVFTVGRGE